MKQQQTKISKRVLAFCLTLCMLIGLVPVMTATAADGHNHDGVIFEPWTATDSLPANGNYYLTADVTVSSTKTLTNNVNLCLDGHNIYTSESNKKVYKIDFLGGYTLNIYDCSNIVQRFDSSGDAWVLDGSTGDEVLYGGIIHGQISLVGGDFKMYGGILYPQTCAAIAMETSTIGSKTISLYGGAIVGCDGMSAIQLSVSYVSGTSRATMNLYDGFRICGNNGSAVQVGTYGILNMYGGRIDHNTGGTGGGIYMVSNGTGISEVNLYGGVIENNKATEAGGGIYANGKLNIKGAPIVRNNTVNGEASNLYTGLAYTQVHLVDELVTGADIGVSHRNIATTAFITSSEVDFLSPLYVGANGYFKSDNANYVTGVLLNKIDLMDKNHTHSTTEGICSGCNRYIHNNMEYLAWERGDSLPTAPGNYYLTTSVQLSSTWIVPEGEVNINLNGKPMSIATDVSGSVIHVPSNARLSLYTSQTLNDTIVWGGKGSSKGGAAYVEGVLINHNVVLQGNGLDGNVVEKGAGVYVANGGTFYAYGGKTSGNDATVAGDGVYVEKGGALHVSGAPRLGETYLETGAVISVDGPLTEGATITPVLQNMAGNVTAASEFVNADTLQYFTAPTDSKYLLDILGNKVIITQTAITVYFTDRLGWGGVVLQTTDGSTASEKLNMTLVGNDAAGHPVYCYTLDPRGIQVIYFFNPEETHAVTVDAPLIDGVGYFPFTAYSSPQPGFLQSSAGMYTYTGLSANTVLSGKAVMGITLYFTNTKNWSKVQAAIQADNSSMSGTFDMLLLGQDADGYDVYAINVDDSVEFNIDFLDPDITHYIDPVGPFTDKSGYYPIAPIAVLENGAEYLNGTYTYTGLDVSTSGGNVSLDLVEFKHSLVFGDYVALNYYVTFDATVTSPERATVRFEYEDGTTLTVSPTLDAEGAVKTTVLNGKTYYIFKCPVDAKEMTDRILATVVLDGQTLGVDINSVENHALTILSMTTVPEKDKTMVTATLTYGAAAQTYFGYKTEHLATDYIPEVK